MSGYSRWNKEQVIKLINFLNENFDLYENGVKLKFCSLAAEALEDRSAAQIRTKCFELEKSFKQAKEIERQHVSADKERTKELIMNKCPWFNELDVIFSRRSIITPPIVVGHDVASESSDINSDPETGDESDGQNSKTKRSSTLSSGGPMGDLLHLVELARQKLQSDQTNFKIEMAQKEKELKWKEEMFEQEKQMREKSYEIQKSKMQLERSRIELEIQLLQKQLNSSISKP